MHCLKKTSPTLLIVTRKRSIRFQ